MKQQFLIRLDDACPTMDSAKWCRIENLLDGYGIRPMVGVVPNCKDELLMVDSPDADFWNKVSAWQKKGWTIALHGYDHCYVSSSSGINPMWRRSEFAGVSLTIQKGKIREGISCLKSNGVYPKYFFAPSHTFDENTLIALREESDIRVVSDTIGRYPYKYKDFYFIPQFVGHCVNMPISGIYTFCFHPNTMGDVSFRNLESFLNIYHSRFIGFEEIDLQKCRDKQWVDKFLSWMFFTYRKIRRIE